MYTFHQQNGLQYEHLENPDVTLLREKIFADENATGNGLYSLFWRIPDLASVAETGGRQPVGDKKGCGAFCNLMIATIHAVLCKRVQGGGGLVQDNASRA